MKCAWGRGGGASCPAELDFFAPDEVISFNGYFFVTKDQQECPIFVLHTFVLFIMFLLPYIHIHIYHFPCWLLTRFLCTICSIGVVCGYQLHFPRLTLTTPGWQVPSPGRRGLLHGAHQKLRRSAHRVSTMSRTCVHRRPAPSLPGEGWGLAGRGGIGCVPEGVVARSIQPADYH